jgi:hypothetical protein
MRAARSQQDIWTLPKPRPPRSPAVRLPARRVREQTGHERALQRRWVVAAGIERNAQRRQMALQLVDNFEGLAEGPGAPGKGGG